MTPTELLDARLNYLNDKLQERGEEFDSIVRELRHINRQLRQRMDTLEKRESSLKKLVWAAALTAAMSFLTRPDVNIMGLLEIMVP